MSELKKQLGLIDVFSIAAGAMISSGLFILPAIAYSKAGPAVVLAYLFASVMILPSLFSKAELSTAMPRAGGTYFFVERSLGSMWGLFGGFAGWFSLALKSAFAIVGMAVLVEVIGSSIYDEAILEPWHIKGIAVVCCMGFTILNILSVKHTSRFQVILVVLLLVILVLFIILGSPNVNVDRYKGFLGKGFASIMATAGLVFISFGGLTKVAAISEEVKNPGKNVVYGMLLAWFVVSVFYVLVVFVTVGVVSGGELEMSEAPVSLAAGKFMGVFGFVLLSIAAAAAFITTANGGILAASRSPLAMSRDQLLPSVFARISERFKTPHISILFTSVFMIFAIMLLEIEDLVKTASTLQLILFILVNASVIIMRESKIQSYLPKFRSPLYPYIQVLAIVIYSALIVDMGRVPLLITAGFIMVSVGWYFIYVRRHVTRASAAMHIVKRVTDKEMKTVTLENELRDILIERDEIIEDRFDQLVKNCAILDIKEPITAQEVFRKISSILCTRLDTLEYVLFEKFLLRETEGGTVVQPGLAIPHIVVDGEDKFDIMLVRSKDGIKFLGVVEPVKIMFVLAGSKDQRNYHLRALMAIAHIVQEKQFEQRWSQARDAEGIRNLILLSARKRDDTK